jgi:hypothetical protein
MLGIGPVLLRTEGEWNGCCCVSTQVELLALLDHRRADGRVARDTTADEGG